GSRIHRLPPADVREDRHESGASRPADRPRSRASPATDADARCGGCALTEAGVVDAAAPPAPGAIDDLVRRIRLVPDLLRDFSESQTDAVRIHRVGRSLLDRLVQAGLPFAGDGAERRFDPLDLANVGLDLGLPSAHRLAMRWWSRALAEIDEGGVTDCVLTVRCACPAPGHPGACDFTLNPESANTPEVLEASRQSDNGYALRLRLSRLERCFAGDQLAVIAEA